MSWSSYESFLICVAVLILVPGPDFAVVTKNTLGYGRRRGAWCAAGVTTANLMQGFAAAGGVGVVLVRAQPVLGSIKWFGVIYLLYLGARAVRSAVHGNYEPLEDTAQAPRATAFGGWREGFLTNITNPKVLAFYLAVLPQYLVPGAGPEVGALFAASHSVLLMLYLFVVVSSVHRVRRVLTRPRARRVLEGATGTVLLGYGVQLACERI